MPITWNRRLPFRCSEPRPVSGRGVLRVAVAASTLALVATGCTSGSDDAPSSTHTATPSSPTPSSPTAEPDGSAVPDQTPTGVTEVVTGLEVPWGVGFLPDGTAVVTERDSGRVLLLPPSTNSGTEEREVVVAGQIDAHSSVESGLLGVAVSPDFKADRLLYFYVTTTEDNRIVKARLDGARLGTPTPILTGIPANATHDGGRLTFGPDGYLYASTGDARDPDQAQDRDSLAGKILRITPDGRPAPDNPWDSPVWSMGHRNVQGLAFDAEDRLWASEFGTSEWDELNLITKGGNFGWPQMEGNDGHDQPGFTAPKSVWNPGENSPSGLAFREGTFWMGALRGARLWSATPDSDDSITSTRGHFVGELGRVRTVITTPNGDLWITTSNRDGRGEPGPSDDRILRVTFD